MVNTLGIGFIF